MNRSLILIVSSLLSLSSAMMDGAEPVPTSRWEWPLRPVPALVRGFVIGPHPWSPGHRGADLAGSAGQPVFAPASGTVSFAGVVAGSPAVSVDHGGGVVSSYVPVRARVRLGQNVEAGAPLGDLLAVGPAAHCLPRTCLHWGVRRDGDYVDPLELVGVQAGPAVLLPLNSDQAA
ncbi:M23 family metallopeptidase [Kineosporia sp. J2-2]|uniref:M23 family metallopeptidase n=1 Tax=Kineosporia corallincola TaxID=2835133 RepID=A0ABS5TFF7_9ACTN|nr:M23 family metallopeptidase [Kineosporia corallincola]MBT0769819.1 M23 family metallopeptidase [Kineosporia corallincola]